MNTPRYKTVKSKRRPDNHKCTFFHYCIPYPFSLLSLSLSLSLFLSLSMFHLLFFFLCLYCNKLSCFGKSTLKLEILCNISPFYVRLYHFYVVIRVVHPRHNGSPTSKDFYPRVYVSFTFLSYINSRERASISL